MIDTCPAVLVMRLNLFTSVTIGTLDNGLERNPGIIKPRPTGAKDWD
jgi:hypothetical protein